jgi:hypothetical protein
MVVSRSLSFGLAVDALEERAFALGRRSCFHDHDVDDLASVGASLCTKILRTC